MTSSIWPRAVIGASLILGIIATAQGQSKVSPARSDAEGEINARLTEIQDAAENLDPERIFSFVLENDRGALIQNGKFFLTRQAALQSTKQGFKGLDKVTYQFDQQHITMLAPTIALVTGHGVSSATTGDGRAFQTRFAQSIVLKRTDGGWKVFHAHRSFPPGE